MDIELFMKKVDKKPYPKHWKKFVDKHYIEQNIFFKFGNKCLCTCCEHEFKAGKGFNIGELAEKYCLDDKVDIVGSLDINSFNGNDSVQIVIKDIRKSY